MREEESEYRLFSRVLLDTIDFVNEKLPKARTVASLLLNRPHEQPEQTVVEASVIITDLIDDVMLAHKAMEAEYYREQERNRDKSQRTSPAARPPGLSPRSAHQNTIRK